MTGWKIVPVEPTEEMGTQSYPLRSIINIYKTMLKAAPDYDITDEDVKRAQDAANNSLDPMRAALTEFKRGLET